MPDPVAAAAAGNEDDVEDLYADLDDQVAAALAAAGESGGSNPATDGEAEAPGAHHTEADANEAVDLGDGTAGYISSDEESEDDLHIVLNEDGAALPPPPAGRCEDRCAEGSEEGEVSGSCVKGLSTDGGRGKLGELHRKGLFEKTTAPITGQGDRGHQHAFQKEFNFFLPKNRTVFDVDIEAFQEKPWRQHGVDLTDYFNFGLDEEGWRKYCFDMEHFRHGTRTLANESSGLQQEFHYNLGLSKAVPKSEIYSVLKEGNRLAKPKGRAIHVEGGMHERLPSADMWPPRQRDSDVIQVNMMFPPSNRSSSDDRSTVNDKYVTAKRCRPSKETSSVVDRVVDKEVHKRGSLGCTRSKTVLGDSSCAGAQSSSPDNSDMLSEESTEDLRFKRKRGKTNSNAFCVGTNRKDEHVLSDLCRRASKSDQESSKDESHRYTPSPADDRYHKETKRQRMDEAGACISSRSLNNCQSDRHLHVSGHRAKKELKRQILSGGKHDLFERQENTTDNYSSRYARKHKHKRSSSTFLGTNYRVHNQLCEKQEYLPLERAALRNDEQCSDDYNQRHRRSWREISDDEDIVECYSTRRWQQRHDDLHRSHSMLKAEFCDDIDGQMYRERRYEETRKIRHDRNGDDEIFHYTDYRFGKVLDPEDRCRYRNQSAESSDEHFRRSEHLVFDHFTHPDQLTLSRQANDNHRKYEKGWPGPAASLTFMRSRNRFIDNERTQNGKMKYNHDGYYEKKMQHDSVIDVDDIQRPSLYTGSVAETGQCIRPVKRRVHADHSMNRKDRFNSSYWKGRRLMHGRSMISDRDLYVAEMHNSPKDIDVEAMCSPNDMRNSNNIPNIYDKIRHEVVNLQPRDTDNMLLIHRKRKFRQQGIEIRREVESDSDLHGSKRKNTLQKVRKLRSFRISRNQVSEKSKQQKQQHVSNNQECEEIEEGELIEQDHQDTASRSKFNHQRKVVLKSVIEASSACQGGVINATSKDADCSNGATEECDNKHILEVMKKMQKRSERFKASIAPQKEEDEDRKESLAVTCDVDDIKNHRPTRKRLWGCSG
uniref:Pre-mRNA polyadenylation factor Fip1 domain-containing protein n=1 Tax=Oryza punctata TaxID=4537 RepID=A0A0E0KCU7_ORYPU